MLNDRGASLFLPVIRWLWSKSAAHVFLSHRLRNEYLKTYHMRSRLPVVIPNALDNEWLNLPLKSRQERTKEVVFVGRWSGEKGMNLIQAAFHERRLGDKRTCHVYGANDVPLDDTAVVFHGWASHDHLRYVISDAELLVLPSYAEAYPNVLIEALACGTPFVSSDVAGMPDIAEQSKAGLTFPTGSVDAFISCIETVLDDDSLWLAMSNRGYAWAQQQSLAHIQRLWGDLIAQIAVE